MTKNGPISFPRSVTEVFQHPMNLRDGNGRIIWGPATIDRFGVHHPAGWVLPGGKRTQNRDIALTAAFNISKKA